MRLIQITDLHLYADPQRRSRVGFPLRQLHAVIAHARQRRPDMVIVTGDISQDETPASYRLAADAFTRLDCPWFWLPGNHDDSQVMDEQQALHDELDLGAWRLLLLNTQVSGHAHGELGQARLQALAERLEEDDRPTLIAMHHPPVEIGSSWMDAIGLVDRETFWQTIAAYAQVRGVVCGHIHQAFAHRHAMAAHEVAVFGTPATADQFLGGAESFAVDEASRPGYRVFELHDQTVTSWVERVEV
ncbi:phosphodiesterase [Litchfieldella xinjiangensis]|uniref:phosphodiesterase n=1 Tax=Litchfieldella xinjiangensis TaxID=1166948 RepID=UPI0005BDE93D|nr:phosphodiesterase [Halomonas xinjiangensis]